MESDWWMQLMVISTIVSFNDTLTSTMYSFIISVLTISRSIAKFIEVNAPFGADALHVIRRTSHQLSFCTCKWEEKMMGSKIIVLIWSWTWRHSRLMRTSKKKHKSVLVYTWLSVTRLLCWWYTFTIPTCSTQHCSSLVKHTPCMFSLELVLRD